MPAQIVAAVEHEVALIAGIAGVLAGIPGVIAAWLSHRTRQENTEQHGANLGKLETVHQTVMGHGHKLDALQATVSDTKADVRDVKADVRGLRAQVDSHDGDIAALKSERIVRGATIGDT